MGRVTERPILRACLNVMIWLGGSMGLLSGCASLVGYAASPVDQEPEAVRFYIEWVTAMGLLGLAFILLGHVLRAKFAPASPRQPQGLSHV